MELIKARNYILCLLLTICIAASGILAVSAEQTGAISLNRISVTMPEITVEVMGTGYENEEITAFLGSERLSVVDIFEYDASLNSSCVYVLVDLSTSMRSSFDLVKSNIITYIKSLNDNDRIILITFGKSEVNIVLNGNENKEDAINTVKALKCNEKGTLFYEALNTVYQLSNSSDSDFDREYVIAFSDGIDAQKGNATFEEVLKLYENHSLPLYAICSSNASKSAVDNFGKLARVSGGSFSIIKSKKEFNSFLNEINKVTIVKLRASTNYADGKEKQLSFKIGSSQVEYNVPIVRSIPDMVAPYVKELFYDAEKDVFVVTFSENVIGATSTGAYRITNSKGKKLDVSEVYSIDSSTYEISTRKSIYKDTYTFEFFGINDDSKEANALIGKSIVVVEKSNNHELTPWVIIFTCAIALAAVIVVLVVNRKNNCKAPKEDCVISRQDNVAYCESADYVEPVQDAKRYHIKASGAVKIRLEIKTGNASEQIVETTIISSLIVGRSDICDIYIDDAKLSRQHFAIENDEGILYLIDLQSRNGTMLNGVWVKDKRCLSSGDKILAGLSDIIITILGR